MARGIDQNTIDDPSLQVSRGVLAQVAAESRPMLTSDAQVRRPVQYAAEHRDPGATLDPDVRCRPDSDWRHLCDDRLTPASSAADLDTDGVGAGVARMRSNTHRYRSQLEPGRCRTSPYRWCRPQPAGGLTPSFRRTWGIARPLPTEHPGPRCYAAGLSVYVHP